MSVTAELRIPGEQFELGRVLQLPPGTTLELEQVVPVGAATIPLFWVYADDTDGFERTIRDRSGVRSLEAVDRFDGRTLYAFDWDASGDTLFEAVRRKDGHVLGAMAVDDTWTFEFRFRSHESLSAFQSHCEDAGIDLDVLRVSSVNEPGGGPWFGLTESQREALTLAVESGYFDIPRRRTTVDLATDLGISDQATTERLRRAIVTLTSNTLLASGATE